MGIKIDNSKRPTVFTITGSLTGELVGDFESQVMPLVGEPGRQIVVDLAGVDRISSEGLSVMVNLTCRANMNKGKVVFARPSLFVSEVLSVTQLDRFFIVAADLEAARDSALAQKQ